MRDTPPAAFDAARRACALNELQQTISKKTAVELKLQSYYARNDAAEAAAAAGAVKASERTWRASSEAEVARGVVATRPAS